jgi:cell division septum initiation protein DivIVA
MTQEEKQRVYDEYKQLAREQKQAEEKLERLEEQAKKGEK